MLKEECEDVNLLQLRVDLAIKQLSSKYPSRMPVRDSMEKTHQRGALELDDSPSTCFQTLDTQKGNSNEEQIESITQQIENKNATKVKDDIRRNENAILKKL